MQYKSMPKRKSLLSGACMAAIVILSAAHASAQEAPSPVQVITPEELEEDRERVVVTGSRIARDTFTSSSPITVITGDGAVLEGLVDTAELLQGSSVAAGSVQLNNSFGGFVVEGGVGINSISLRGLGAQRSLVLINGKRPGPAGTRGQVGSFDLNVMPNSIIDRVEVLKDGASSIYGSDAVAGVANLITRSSIDRPELTVQYNKTTLGGGDTFQVDGAIGHDWSNGSLMAAFEYEDLKALKNGDRSWARCNQDYVYDPDTGARIDREDRSILAGTDLGGCTDGNIYHNTVIVGASRFIPSPDGVTIGPLPGYRPRTNQSYAGGGQAYFEDVLNDQRYLDSDLLSATQRFSVYAKSDVTLTNLGNVDWTTELLYNHRETELRRLRQFFPVIAPPSGYDVPGDYGGSPTPFPTALARPVVLWPSNDDVSVDYYYLSSGLTGGFGSEGFLSNFTWEVNASYSKSEGEYTGNEINVETAGDWLYPNADGLFYGPNYDGFDPEFLKGNPSPAVYDLLTINAVGTTAYEQTVFDALVTGDVFDLPAGPVGLALGAQYRTFEIDDRPAQEAQDGLLWGTSSALTTQGDDAATEYFAELSVPILRGTPGFEELTFDGSVRAFDYDSYGDDSVWKAGLNWQVVPAVRLRATKGTSYRAPALYELFLGNQTSFLPQDSVDPCIDWANSSNENIRNNCSAAGIPGDYQGASTAATIVTGGGFGVLDAETSDAETIGVIFTPTELNLSVAIDYFDITINDQVANLGSGTILGGCYGLPTFPNAFCNLFDRNSGSDPTAAYAVTEVRDSFINVNEQSTRGIDFEIRYEHEFDVGNLIVDLTATKTLEDVNLLFDTGEESGFETNDFNGTIGDPEWVGALDVQFKRGDLTFAWFVDYVDGTDNTILGFDEDITYFGRPGRIISKTDPWLSHDLSIRWVQDDFTLTGGVANVFNAQPPIISADGGQRIGNIALAGTQYDYRGRTIFARVTRRF